VYYKNNILRLFGRGLSLEPEARTTWATSRKANKTWKNKKTQAKPKKQTKDFWENAENQTKNVFDRFQCRKPNQKC
jgi:hypothetical protein